MIGETGASGEHSPQVGNLELVILRLPTEYLRSHRERNVSDY